MKWNDLARTQTSTPLQIKGFEFLRWDGLDEQAQGAIEKELGHEHLSNLSLALRWVNHVARGGAVPHLLFQRTGFSVAGEAMRPAQGLKWQPIRKKLESAAKKAAGLADIMENLEPQVRVLLATAYASPKAGANPDIDPAISAAVEELEQIHTRIRKLENALKATAEIKHRPGARKILGKRALVYQLADLWRRMKKRNWPSDKNAGFAELVRACAKCVGVDEAGLDDIINEAYNDKRRGWITTTFHPEPQKR